eukprot:comp21497_c0_seq1/m.29804 comp21497_c0_seq1/g.29804  ORF comp21497_c0_seq1/g.29804 comp21497_c0_seq1/m.29804 type:complete len:213 (-) comp21497_c0_seq1:430-1068(-)
MNIFRAVGDLSHALAICLLLYKIWTSRSCAGVSLKAQALFMSVFMTRYLDLFTSFVSLYNTVMKIFFITASAGTVYLMAVKFKATYTRDADTFPVYFLVGGALVAGLIFNYEFTPMEILWSFSIWLESVAIMPQLWMISKTGEAESITSHYLFALGSYRGLYLFNWVYRYAYENHFDWIAIVAGLIQTGLYCDFFYLYITRVLKSQKLKLPA